MITKKRLPYLIIAGIILILGTAFAIRHNTKNRQISIIYIPKVQDENNDFWTTLISGANMAAEELNIDLTVLSPESETDYEGQQKLIKQAAQMKPDVLMISPISYTESTELLKEIKAELNIPIVLVDSIVSEPIEDVLIASDNFEAGQKVGNFALNYIDDNSQIAIVSHVPNASTAIDREKGFYEALGDKSDNIIDTVYCYSDFDKAYSVTVDLLKKYPKLSLIVGLNEYSAVGAGRAVEDLGMTEQVHLIGFDNSISAIQLLENGTFLGIVVQKPFNMGYLGVKAAYKTVIGEPTEKVINSGTQLFTIDDIYTYKGQQELFSFLQN